MADERTFAEEWGSYQRVVLPVEAGPEQLIETRRAFYAGAHAVICLMNSVFADVDEPTAVQVAYAEQIGKEIRDFVRLVDEGRG